MKLLDLKIDEKNKCLHRWVMKWVVIERKSQPIYAPETGKEQVLVKMKRVKRHVCARCGMMRYRASGNIFRPVKREKVILDRAPKKSDTQHKEENPRSQPGVFDSR